MKTLTLLLYKKNRLLQTESRFFDVIYTLKLINLANKQKC